MAVLAATSESSGGPTSVARTSTRPFLLRLSDSIVMTLGAVAWRGQAWLILARRPRTYRRRLRDRGSQGRAYAGTAKARRKERSSTALNNKYTINRQTTQLYHYYCCSISIENMSRGKFIHRIDLFHSIATVICKSNWKDAIFERKDRKNAWFGCCSCIVSNVCDWTPSGVAWMRKMQRVYQWTEPDWLNKL